MSTPACTTTSLPLSPLAEDFGVKINGTDLIQILLNLAVNALSVLAEKSSSQSRRGKSCSSQWT